MSCQTLCCAALLSLAPTLATPIAVSQETTPVHVPPGEVLVELDWLAGTWSGDMWGGRFVAYYSTPEGGKILSHSQLLKEGGVAFYEFEVFESRELLVHLTPYPGGKRADGFRMQSYDPDERKIVFENPDKDFPTRITYHRVAENRLDIVLSDPHGGSTKVDRFELTLD